MLTSLHPARHVAPLSGMSIVCVVCIVSSALMLVGCGASGVSTAGSSVPAATPTTPTAQATTPATAAISIGGSQGYYGKASAFRFTPSTLTVPVGTTVVWTNTTDAPHTATSDSGDPAAFNGSLDNYGATFRFTFSQPGTYKYHCNVHPSMLATIVVTP